MLGNIMGEEEDDQDQDSVKEVRGALMDLLIG